MLRTPFEVVRDLEYRLRLAPGTFDWTGPLDPQADPLWRRLQAGEITEPGYWAARAEEVAAVTGEPGVRAMMRLLYPRDEIETHLRKEAYDTLARAKTAGLRTAVLTNDLVMFLDPETIARIRFLAQVDAVMDGSVAGIYKPDPLAYHEVLDSLGVASAATVFVDDQPRNVAGAQAVGMRAVFFDVTRPRESYRALRQVLGFT